MQEKKQEVEQDIKDIRRNPDIDPVTRLFQLGDLGEYTKGLFGKGKLTEGEANNVLRKIRGLIRKIKL